MPPKKKGGKKDKKGKGNEPPKQPPPNTIPKLDPETKQFYLVQINDLEDRLVRYIIDQIICKYLRSKDENMVIRMMINQKEGEDGNDGDEAYDDEKEEEKQEEREEET